MSPTRRALLTVLAALMLFYAGFSFDRWLHRPIYVYVECKPQDPSISV